MKQTNNFVGVGVETGEIRALVQIALMTRPCQVLQIIGPPVLPRDDMLHVKRVEAVVTLVQAAVLATIARPKADLLL